MNDDSFSDTMDNEALKPTDLNLLSKLQSNPTSTAPDVVKPEVLGAPTPRRRGRPPGSKNKVTSLSEEAQKKAEIEAKRKAKAEKAKAYTEKIVTDLNEQIMDLFVGLGVPSTLLYKDGHAPVRFVDNKYTDLGNALAIKPNQAKAVANFIAEMESTGIGSKVSDTLADSTVSTVIKGAVAGFACYQYAKSIAKVYQQLAPLIEAHKEMQRQQQAERVAPNGR